MKKEDISSFFNSQVGKVNILLLISFVAILVVYAVLVFADSDSVRSVLQFPLNNTNASATIGIGDTGFTDMKGFNGTNATFKCIVNMTGNQSDINITNILLFINETDKTITLNNKSSAVDANQSFAGSNLSLFANNTIFIFNVSSTFNEGLYGWMCHIQNNQSNNASGVNQSGTNYFFIDRTPPGFSNLTNTSRSTSSTSDNISIAVNVSDGLTSVHSVILYVNTTGAANNRVGAINWTALNTTMANITFSIPGHLVGAVLNFTISANDSVNNVNLTQSLIFSIDGDRTPPGPITLNAPIPAFNQSSATAPVFNFTAIDNNDTQFVCGINISFSGSQFVNISGLNVTNGTAHVNTTTTPLSNGTYTWNVSCTDGAGNLNTSLSRTFTVDNIPPVFVYYNITLNTSFDPDLATNDLQLGTGATNGTAQGRRILILANWTDNLTKPLQGAFQFFNETSDSWQTINNSPADYKAPENESWTNFTWDIPTGRNEFEGRNVSFRIIANDTVGNVNNSRSFKNFTVRINDTTLPEIIINSTLSVNGTNISDTTPLVSWNILEGKRFNKINVSVDATDQNTENTNGCSLFKQFASGPGTANDPNAHRNDSLQISSAGTCPLSNSLHNVTIVAVDSASNSQTLFHTFSVQNQTSPALFLVSLTSETLAATGKNAINNSNITSRMGVQLGGAASGGLSGSNIANLTYISSCDSSSTVVFANNTIIFPFNASTCPTTSANRTLTVTVTDTAGNSNTTVLGFLVDNAAPTITIHSPTNGQTFTSMRTTLNFSVLDTHEAISFTGYYLDGNQILKANHTINRSIGEPAINITTFTLVNHTGKHTIKFTFNDTLGNGINSSEIAFVQFGTIVANATNLSLSSYLSQVNPGSTVNVSVSIKDSNGIYTTIGVGNNTEINNTFEILVSLNTSSNSTQVILTEINGSNANWDKINFSIDVNDTTFKAGVENNFTVSLLSYVVFNSSIDDFLPNANDYYGKVLLPFNINGSNRLAQEIWYFPNVSDLTSRTNVSSCSAAGIGGYGPTLTTPCWNFTSGNKTLVLVPHFSGVGIGNDTTPPAVTINFPKDTQTVADFFANITVSNDAVLCNVTYVGTNSSIGNRTMDGPTAFGPNKICTFHLNVSNGTIQNNNMTFNVFDASNNNITIVFNFNVSDTTNHTASVSIGSVSSTGATITVTANESVNMSVNSTGSTSFTNPTSIATVARTQSITLSSLSASTTYNLTVITCDKAGNCLTNTTLGFTTDAAAAAAAAAAATAAASSSGGGGAVAPSNVQASAGRQWDSLAAGSSGVLTINNENIAVTGVVIDVKNDVTNPSITVESLTSNPLSTAAAAKVYQYLQLKKSNIADLDASKIAINFRVPKSWLSSNNVAEDSIVLYRYSDNTWNALPTVKTGADANNVIYQSTTSGFSTFAIGTTEAAPAVAPPAEAPPEAAPPTEVPTEEVPAAPEAQPTPEAKKGLGRTAIAWIVVAIIVVAAAVGYYIWQKKKAE